MSICLLGLVEQLIPTVAGRTMGYGVGLLLFYAITLHWKKPAPPTSIFWKRLVNKNLPLYKDTYINRGYPKKYQMVWSKWLAEPSTA